MKRAYGVALLCGVLPLLVGISVFLLWLITRWESLIIAGILTLYGGVAVFFLGAIALARYSWLAFRTPQLPRRRLWRSTLGCAALLLSNFPVAGGMTVAAVAIQTCYTVVVHNASRQALEGVRVHGGGCDESLGSIPPGGSCRRSFWIRRDGHLEFLARGGTATHAEVIDDYVTRNLGGYTTITVRPDGTVSVTAHRR